MRFWYMEHVIYILDTYLICDNLGSNHGVINYTDTKAKCRHLKKFTCEGILRQGFIRVYKLEIQSVMLVFSTQLCELLPL